MWGSGCGECVFEEELRGTLVDQDGDPVSGALITACRGNRCDPGGSQGCVTATSGMDGTFTLLVPQCRPAPGECALIPLKIEKGGCEGATVQPARQTPEQTFTLMCS